MAAAHAKLHMTARDHENLIHDWNEPLPRVQAVQFDEETLRDGLQSPSARDPSLDEKIRLVHLMDELGIQTADVGLPGASARAREHIETLVREMAELSIHANVACRTLVSDIAPAVEMAQKTGQPIEVCCFIGSSPIRQYAEGWEMERRWRSCARRSLSRSERGP
jgi:2-isopropylmalate synthase